MNLQIRTRFAPSPTGRLHLGHAVAARIARDLANHSDQGSFLLRFEDIDETRVREEYYQGIEEDLKWLGLTWDEEPLRQTSRKTRYEETLEQLQRLDLIYPCFCTRRQIQEEWSQMASAPQGEEGPIYPGTCLRKTVLEREEKLALGHPHAWRLNTKSAAEATGPLTFHDLRFGSIPVIASALGDVVLARKDIGVAYHLAVVVDDAFQDITHVTRGEDLLPSTHVHRMLQQLLGLPQPVYFHHPLVLDEKGRRLAKRSDSLSIATLRKRGISAADVLDTIQKYLPIRPLF